MRWIICLMLVLLPSVSQASVFTRNSPLNGGTTLAPAVTEVGGIVFHAKGLNGAVLTSQLAASSLFSGFSNANPFTIGSQIGYNNTLLSQLGGGFSEIAVRISLEDGDTGAGNFDEDDNYLMINGVGSLALTNFSDVVTQETTNVGVAVGALNGAGGFRNNLLDTGFFYITDNTALSSIFTNLSSTGILKFELFDTRVPGDNFFDFTRGIDGSLINVGQGPIVVGTVPEPASIAVFSILPVLGLVRRRRRASR